MPRIVFKGIELEELKSISKELIDELTIAVETTRDNFILEYPESKYIFDGEEIKTYPLIEINWFKRSKEIEKKVYEIIDNKIKKLGYEEVEVYFVELKEESYYY